MENELTPEGREELKQVVLEFNGWINDQIKQHRLYLHTLADLVAMLYLRIRMQLVREDGIGFIERIVSHVENRIDVGDIMVEFLDGGSFKYISAEDILEHPELREMLETTTQPLTDDEINKLLDELENE
jgi:hypothetical protein